MWFSILDIINNQKVYKQVSSQQDMRRLLENAGAIVLGGITLVVVYAGFQSLAESTIKRELQNHQTIGGTVVEENLIPGFMKDEYKVSIIKSPGNKKVLVSYSPLTARIDEPSALNTLFAPGDTVELDVATYGGYDGKQRFLGISGRLVFINIL